jgi:glucose-1-phosphate thymidylyltransferase
MDSSGDSGIRMKGLVLSGGKGSRLRPLTHTRAKQLVPVANRPILHYVLEDLATAGIREVGIVVGDTEAEIRESVGDGSGWGLSVTYIRQDAPLGLAHAVKISRDYLGDDPFVMYLGDNLLHGGIRGFVEEFRREPPNALVLLASVPDPQRFGVAELRDGRIVSLEEKPAEPKSDKALVGVYLFDSNVFPIIDELKPSGRGELEITDAIQALVDEGREVRPHVVSGWWKDTGRLRDLLEANRMVLDGMERRLEGEVDGISRVEGKVILEPGSRVEKSVLRGPLIVGSGTEIRDSYVGPFTSIEQDVRVEGCELEHSIVLRGTRLLHVPTRIVDSLIGREVEIRYGDSKPNATSFMIGDLSRIRIR